MGAAPTGTVTFLFTDIEGSTRLWEAAPEHMPTALARHDELLRSVFGRHDGRVFATGGDGFAVAFGRATDAIDAAGEVLSALGAEQWPPGVELRVRVGVHTGEATERDGDYFGSTVNRTARLMSLAHGGQALCTDSTLGVLDDVPSTVDLGEHRLRDVSTPVRVHQLGTTAFPPLRSLAQVPSNLPSPATDLLGREPDAAGVVDELSRHRLVTISGVGGIGKTRLAIEVAASVAPAYRDGVWFVDLAPASGDGEIVRSVAAAMGATAAASSSEALISYLEGRQILVVLDNCEHVIDAVASFADAVLVRVPQVTMLATSREPLDVAGESVRHLRPLAMPEESAYHEVHAGEFPALRLFEERAGAARSGFVVDDSNVEDVVEICRRLDGVPLAIELAAARVGAMSTSDMREHLGERFRLLSSRRGTERHRTLQAAVAWSYDLLDSESRRVFRCLSVFVGGFGLEDAAAVVGGPDADPFDVPDQVTRLVDRSLVVRDGDAGRYRLLETLRQFGSDRLVESGEAVAVRERFVAHFLALAVGKGPAMFGPEHRAARIRIADGLDSLRPTAELLAADRRWPDLASFVTSLWLFVTQEAPAEALAWLRPALDEGVEMDPQVRYDALWAGATLALLAGDFVTALELDQRTHVVCERHPEVSESAWGHHVSVTIGAHLPDSESIAKCDRMSDAAKRSGNADAASFARSMKLLFVATGDPSFYDEVDACIAEARARPNPTWLGAAISNACAGLIRDGCPGDHTARVKHLVDSNPGWREAGSLIGASILGSLSLSLAASEPQSALVSATEAARCADRIGNPPNVNAALTSAAFAAALLGSTDSAAKLYRHTLATALYDNPYNAWARAEIERILGDSGMGGDALAPTALSRHEIFGLLSELQRQHPVVNR